MKWIKPFLLCAGGILLMAALTRLLIASGNMQALALPDPLLGVPLRYTMVIVGALELVVALICLFGRRVGLQIGWLAWLGTNYVVVWIGLLAMHIHPQATGIGIFTDPLQIHRGLTGCVFAIVPFFLALGSYTATISLWFSAEGRAERLAEARQSATRRDTTAGLMKMICPACGGHVKFPAQNIGRQIPCPHCQAAIRLQKPDETFKMTCVLCGGHVEFPPHAVGQKIPCPHCSKTITLLKPT